MLATARRSCQREDRAGDAGWQIGECPPTSRTPGPRGPRLWTLDPGPWTWTRPLLDAERDAAEIAHLRDRIKKLESVPRWITPIVIPLKSGLTALDLVDDDAPPQHHVGAAAVWQRPPPNCAAWRCGTTGTAMASASVARSVPSPRGAARRSRRPTTSGATHPHEIPWSSAGVRFVDGTVRPTFDVVLRRR